MFEDHSRGSGIHHYVQEMQKRWVSLYHGETSRTPYGRLVEHARGHNNKHEEKPLFKHDATVHEGERQRTSLKDFSRTPSQDKLTKG